MENFLCHSMNDYIKKNKEIESEDFCCHNMNYYVKKNKEIQYDSSIRKFFMIIDDPDGTHQLLFFCPWCGSKLPEVLEEEWGDILEKEYGIKDPCWDEEHLVPKEFKTDEWWKKRGL